MDYMVDPTYCLTKNGSHYFYDQDCVEEASNHTTCIANVYRNGLFSDLLAAKTYIIISKKIVSKTQGVHSKFQRADRVTFRS